VCEIGEAEADAMEYVEVDGLRIAYERAGHGPPLVLAHGYVGDAHATWRHQIEALSDEFTVVAWDAPGAGRSSDPPELFGMDGYADSLASFIAQLGLGQAHVAGLSFGGALALELSHRHPAVPLSLVLVSAYAGWAGSLPADVADARLEQALQLSELRAEAFVDALLPTMFSATTPREDIDAFGAAMREFHPRGFRAMARASAEDLRGALPSIRMPTLLIYGDSDERAPLNVAEHLHASISGSDLVVIPRAGHVCNIEAADHVNHIMRNFLGTRHD
jgi:pimeloyl-ACP methyl ester carboxylesterase